MPWTDDSDYWREYWESELGPWESKQEVTCAACNARLTLDISEWKDRPGFSESDKMIDLECPECGRPSGYEYDVEHSSVSVRKD